LKKYVPSSPSVNEWASVPAEYVVGTGATTTGDESYTAGWDLTTGAVGISTGTGTSEPVAINPVSEPAM